MFNSKYLVYKIRKNLRKEIPRWIVLVIDLYVSINTFLLAFVALKFLGIRPNLDLFQVVTHQIPQVLIFSYLAFLISSSYKGIIRHSGTKDFLKVLQANLIYLVLMSLFYWFGQTVKLAPEFLVGKILILAHFLLNVFALVFLRIFYKIIYDNFVVGEHSQRRVMIYGAGESGVMTYKVIEGEERGLVTVIGFIDDKIQKVGKKINGIKIYHPKDIHQDFIEKHEIDEIIVSIQNIKPSRLRDLVNRYSDSPVELKIVPSMKSWLNGDLTSQQIKAINIEDLLGREPIELDKKEVTEELKFKTILVTGAAGSIGSEISRQLMNHSVKKLILVDQAESALYELEQTSHPQSIDCHFLIADIRNQQRMEEIISLHQPDFIFHAAAYKHVPLMEANPFEAVGTNINGTKILADLAVKYKVEKFVLISTDKAVNPTNVMGATKRVAELYVSCMNKKAVTNFIVTRFGNVLDSNGSVIPIFKRQLKEGGPLTVTHPEVTRFFMTIPEACQLVLEAGVMGKNGEVFVFDMGESVRIMDLAKNLIRLSGLHYPKDIDIKITGLRPGEKIYEELLADDESCIKTHHPKILIAKVNQSNENFESKFLDLLDIYSSCNVQKNNMLLVAKLKELLPEYKSENSIFSSID